VVLVEDTDWNRLIDQLREGDCTPFLGAGACHGVLPSGRDMSQAWADEYDYPFADSGDLARVMQYAASEVGDPVDLKKRVCTKIRSVRPPDFSDPAEPHALLAEFPIPVFITTNYDDFLVKALTSAGKSPNSAVCSWSTGIDYDKTLFETAAGMKPDSAGPLVYHLHGSVYSPRSLVLTENDYLEFLVKLASSHETEELRVIPSAVLSALTANPLLFIGYSLQDWTFRVIFHGLLSTIPDVHRRRGVSVQLLPPLHGSIVNAENRARKYLNSYLAKWQISIYWGTATEFCHELRDRASSRP